MLNVLYGDRVDAGEGLIEHHKLRVDGQTAGNLAAAALTTGQTVALVLAHLRQSELADERLQLVELLLMREFRHLQHRHDVVFHAELAEYARLLRQVADAGPGPLVDGIVGDLLAVEIDMTAVGHHQTCGHIERRGLSRSVRTEQTNNFTLSDVEAHVVGHGARAVSLDEAYAAQLHQVLRRLLGCLFDVFLHDDCLFCLQKY